jgi:hypothetical protein
MPPSATRCVGGVPARRLTMGLARSATVSATIQPYDGVVVRCTRATVRAFYGAEANTWTDGEGSDGTPHWPASSDYGSEALQRIRFGHCKTKHSPFRDEEARGRAATGDRGGRPLSWSPVCSAAAHLATLVCLVLLRLPPSWSWPAGYAIQSGVSWKSDTPLLQSASEFARAGGRPCPRRRPSRGGIQETRSTAR